MNQIDAVLPGAPAWAGGSRGKIARMRNDRAQTGAAGAFYTAGQLSQRGWAASLTIGNMPRTDVVAQHTERGTLIAVQCKASTGVNFQVGVGGESPPTPEGNEWFVLAELGDPEARPEFYVVPRAVVGAYVYIAHRAWLTGKSRSDKPHRDSSMRNINASEVAAYKERWDLLHEPANAVPTWVPDWWWGWFDEFDLPKGYPPIVRPEG